MAASEKELRSLVGESKDIAREHVEIGSIEYVDTKNTSAAFVNYKNTATGKRSNIVIAEGVFNYDPSHLQVKN